jgi:predicted SprT family Zn-dependent metalloprotease
MNLTIKYDVSATDYCGEFVEPNIIKIYVNQCRKVKRSIKNVIAHEHVHYIIYNINILHYLINKLNGHSIKNVGTKEL